MKTLIILAQKKYRKLKSFVSNIGLYHPNGNLLISEAIRGVNPEQFDRVIVASKKENFLINEYCESLEKEFEEVYNVEIEFCEVSREKNPLVNNIKQIIRTCEINGSIVIIDMDYIFKLPNTDFKGNGFITTDFTKLKNFNLENKFFIGEYGISNDVKSNKVINGFYFEDAKQFLKYASKQVSKENMSLIVDNMIKENIEFNETEAIECDDVSTLYLWRIYQNKHRTIFVDLDGIIFRHREKRFCNRWLFDEYPIKTNINTINELYRKGKCYIIILTERPDDEGTRGLINKYNIKYHRLIGDLPSSARMIISAFDYHHFNPNVTAVNLPKNTESLKWSINYED